MGREPAPMIADFAQLINDNKVDVALHSDQHAGYVVSYVVDGVMHLENVAVWPALSKQGVGKSLITHVEVKARAQGLAAVELYTNEAMTDNQLIYPKLGYHEIDRRTEAGFSRVYYRKALDHKP